MVPRPIPFVDPDLGNAEIEAIQAVIRSKSLVEGQRVKSFEKKFSKFSETKHSIAVTNGTVALHLAMEASPIKPGDEVITTPFTFIATSNSVTFTGAIPIFSDIDTNTWNLDPELVEKNITEKTKAIMPVHIFGLAADMPRFREIADDNDLFLIEDAAQAFGAKINGKHVGGFGDLGTFSLYVTKNLISGEGGLITTDSDELADKIISLKNHGRTSKGGYIHEIIGYNARMSDVAGAIADVQMDKISLLLDKRMKISNRFRKIIDEIDLLNYQQTPQGFEHGNYIFALDTRNTKIKPYEAISKFKELGISSRRIYSTLSYQQDSFKNMNRWRWSEFVNYPDYSSVQCPIAEDVSINHFEIPIVPSLSEEEIQKVEEAIIEIFT